VVQTKPGYSWSFAEIPPLPSPATDAREGEGVAGRLRRPSAPTRSSAAADRRNEEEDLHYGLYRRGRPALSQSLRPARPPEEREREAGGSTPLWASVARGGGEERTGCVT
jgi:hypothetical protein